MTDSRCQPSFVVMSAMSKQQQELTTDSSQLSFIVKPTTGCRARSTSLWVHRNIFWQLSRDGNLHGSGMSHAMTSSPEPSFRAPWRVVDAVVGRGNVRWTTSKSGHPCPCQNCSQGPPAEKTGRDLCWIVPHVPLVTQSVKALS